MSGTSEYFRIGAIILNNVVESPLMVYTTTWCADCVRTKAFLNRHQIAFHEVNIERDDDAADLVLRLNGGHQSVPTIVFADGAVMTEPSNRDLATRLGLTPGSPVATPLPAR